MTFGEKLRKLCEERGTNPTRVGRALGGVPKTTMHNWSTGTSRPDLETALKIARHFGVGLDYLADDALEAQPVESPALSEDEAYLLRVYRDLKLDPSEAMRRLAHPVPPQDGAPPHRVEITREVSVHDLPRQGQGSPPGRRGTG